MCTENPKYSDSGFDINPSDDLEKAVSLLRRLFYARQPSGIKLDEVVGDMDLALFRDVHLFLEEHI